MKAETTVSFVLVLFNINEQQFSKLLNTFAYKFQDILKRFGKTNSLFCQH